MDDILYPAELDCPRLPSKGLQRLESADGTTLYDLSVLNRTTVKAPVVGLMMTMRPEYEYDKRDLAQVAKLGPVAQKYRAPQKKESIRCHYSVTHLVRAVCPEVLLEHGLPENAQPLGEENGVYLIKEPLPVETALESFTAAHKHELPHSLVSKVELMRYNRNSLLDSSLVRQ